MKHNTNKGKEKPAGSFESSDGSGECRICRKHHDEPGWFEGLGIMLRLPLFIVLVILKILIAFPFELIIIKILIGGVLFVGSVLGIAKAFLFSDRYYLKEHEDTLREVGGQFFDFEAFDFAGVIHFLRYGR
jgi:hypothetical protein